MTNCIHAHARWGTGNQLGAANLLAPENTVAALSSVTEGRTYDLNQVISRWGRRGSRPCSLPV